jgi:hypothetical protein
VTAPLIEQHDDIRRARDDILRRERDPCVRRKGGEIRQCWCYGAGPDGGNLPCPDPPAGAILKLTDLPF